MRNIKKNLILFLLATQVVCLPTYVNKKAKALDISEKDSVTTTWTAQDTANYILTHLDELNEKRAKDGYLTAVYSGEVSDIIVDMSSQPTVEGLLIDFDGSKGYIVVGPDQHFYAYSSEYNPPFNDFTSGVHHYDEKLGFWYEDAMGNQVILGEPGNQQDATPDNPSGFLYEGQHISGEYTIYDTDAYMHDRYGEEYELNVDISIHEKRFVKGFEYYNSMVYYEDLNSYNGEIIGPEINSLLAATSVVDYICCAKDFGDFNNIIKLTYTPRLEEYDLYAAKVAAGYRVKALKEIKGDTDFRKYVVNTYHEDANLNLIQIKDAIINYMASRDVKVKAKWINGVEVLLKVYLHYFTDNRPLIMYNPTGYTYNDHYSVICGLRQYDKVELVIGNITRRRTKTLVEIRDSKFYAEKTYFDVYTYEGTDSQVYAFEF